jgi:hypothetical protein
MSNYFDRMSQTRLSKIPTYIDAIHSNLEDSMQSGRTFFLETILPRISNPSAHFEIHEKGIATLKTRWIEWKNQYPSDKKKIEQYDQKIAACDAFLALMKEVLIGKSTAETAPPIHASSSCYDPSSSQDSADKLDILESLMGSQPLDEKSIDRAFEITKSMKNHTARNYRIFPSVFAAYLNLNTTAGCQKAFAMYEFVEQLTKQNILDLKQIIDKCLELHELYPDPDLQSLLTNISDSHPNMDLKSLTIEIRDLFEERKFSAILTKIHNFPESEERNCCVLNLIYKICYGPLNEKDFRFAIQLAPFTDKGDGCFIRGFETALSMDRNYIALEMISVIKDPIAARHCRIQLLTKNR